MATRRNWPARRDVRTLERTLRSHRAALPAAWLRLAARLSRPAFAPWADRVLGRSFEAPATSAPAASALVIRRRRYGNSLHFIVRGELDVATAGQLRQQCQRVDLDDVETVLLDLADLTSMDGSGLGVLFAAYAHLGERLVIIIGPAGAETIELANVRDVLPIIEG